ncbi:hypothetical protein LJR267_002862 [Paraburkholderia hospita]
MVDGRGVPLSLIVTGANVNDGKRLDEVLSAARIPRIGAASTCAPMRATEAPSAFTSSMSITTFLMSSIVGRRRTSSGAIRRKRPGAGW